MPPTSPQASGPVVKAVVLEAPDIARALKRMAHEILERNHGAEGVVLVGIRRRGVPLADRLSAEIERIEGVRPPTGALDISFYRDDIGIRTPAEVGRTEIDSDIEGRIVVLVDDVLYTGRTVRAAIDALVDFGRPRAVQLAVLIDRGHRELPIRADFIGRNLPTAHRESVDVRLAETDGLDSVSISEAP
ncbi:MAG TPA: bifunctional pyr operon transcriptional regulator/uracil phosphoribosyltransferase PyrR [Actinomycetota bacterium]|nr:bifunctional pyr operon transcriptional regulator/uracil phosphoribosyltransferase PyrR [Actinomycetota bacterium]